MLSKEFYKSEMLPHLADWRGPLLFLRVEFRHLHSLHARTAIFLEKHVNGQAARCFRRIAFEKLVEGQGAHAGRPGRLGLLVT